FFVLGSSKFEILSPCVKCSKDNFPKQHGNHWVAPLLNIQWSTEDDFKVTLISQLSRKLEAIFKSMGLVETTNDNIMLNKCYIIGENLITKTGFRTNHFMRDCIRKLLAHYSNCSTIICQNFLKDFEMLPMESLQVY